MIAIQDALCPAPWRVPTYNDLYIVHTAGWDRIVADWGFGGIALGADVIEIDSSGRIWASTRDFADRTTSYLRWNSKGDIVLATSPAAQASEVRCVK
jgi:hypothetical protein